MNPKMRRQAWPLAIALSTIALSIFMMDASIMAGQPDADGLVFEPPKVTTSTARQMSSTPAAPKPASATQKPAYKGMPVGKANVVPNTVQNASKPRHFPVQPADPKQIISTRQAMSAANKPPSSIVPASANSGSSADSAVTTASHFDPMQAVTPDGGDATLLHQRKRRIQNGPPMMAVPGDRASAPNVRGSILGLNGEPASMRLIQAQSTIMELERENDELRQQNVGLMSRVKESHDQLVSGVREIQLARKELTTARSDLDRLRNDLQSLRDKVRIAEREYSAVLQSMGPLLQQLLESDEVSSLPPNPSE